MRAQPSKRTPRIVHLFFSLCSLPLLFVFPYIASINNPNENVRTYMTIALVENRTLCIDEIVARYGWVNDMARVPEKNGSGAHFFSVKAPAVSYAGVPVYWAFTKIAPKLGHPIPGDKSTPEARVWWLRAATWALRIFTVQIPCFAFLIAFERYLRSVSSDVTLRLCAVAAAGLGTNYLAYALTFCSHALFAVAAFACFAITETELRESRGNAKRRRWGRAFWAGFFAGWATLLEYHALPVSLILSIYALLVFWRPTRLLAFVAGGSIHAATMMVFQWRAFGNPLTPGHKMVENAQFAAEHQQGVFGLLAPKLDAFVNLSVDPGYGFFGSSPFMWLGLLAIPFALFFTFGSRRERRLRRVATFCWLLAMVALWVIMSGAIEWRAGWTIGPRYLGAAPPFFAFGAVCALEALARRGKRARAIARGLSGGLALSSVVSMGLVSIVYNTLPTNVARPLSQIALPLVRAGFVPYSVGEWIGWKSNVLWYVAAACLIGAPLLAAVWKGGDRPLAYGARLLIVGLSCRLALLAPLQMPPDEPGEFVVQWFADIWEPPGRDRITALRVEAERYGPRRPCMWHRIAGLELGLKRASDADRDTKRASAPKSACAPRYLF